MKYKSFHEEKITLKSIYQAGVIENIYPDVTEDKSCKKTRLVLNIIEYITSIKRFNNPLML